jgi:hypothetical protein
MKANRILLPLLLLVLLVLSSVPAADAQRACADAYSRCTNSCSQTFGGWLGGLMTAGCDVGCNIGYVSCASSN